MSSADGAKGLCPLDARSSPERRPLRAAQFFREKID